MRDEKTNWRELIGQEMQFNGEKWADVVFCTISDKELDREFNDGYGLPEGTPFYLWTIERVYFPVTYDGSEYVSSVPRSPTKNCDPRHVGGY